MAAGWRNPRYDLKEQDGAVFEQALALSFALCAMVFLTYQTFEAQAYQGSGEMRTIQLEQIPETQQLQRPPPPQRPQIPIATEDESIPDDVTIMQTDIDLTAPPPPPPPPPGRQQVEPQIFVAFDKAPVLIKRVEPVYPEIAKKAGVSGQVILLVVVDEQGNVAEAEVFAASPPNIFEQAALDAVVQFKFEPALQRDRPVRVRIRQTIDFVMKTQLPPGR